MKRFFASILFSMGLIMTVCAAQARAQEKDGYLGVTIYLRSWIALTRAPLSIEDAMQYPQIKLETSDPESIDNIIHQLDLKGLTCAAEDPWGDNVRLVVELRKRDGTVETVYASRSELCTQNPRCCRRIRSEFRERFNFYQSCFGECHAELTEDGE